MSNLQYELAVDDTSPLIYYRPNGDAISTANLSSGWIPVQGGSNNSSLGTIGIGPTSHTTNLNGASVIINFKGKEIRVYGGLNNASINQTIDGQPSTNNGTPSTADELICLTDLNDSGHSLLLMAITSGDEHSYVAIDRFVLWDTLGISNSTLNKVSLPEDKLAFVGKWTFDDNQDLNGGLHESATANDSLRFTFKGPSIEILGVTTFDSGHYSVSLDGVTEMYQGRSPFNSSVTTLFYASGLDFDKDHTLELINVDGGRLLVSENGVYGYVYTAETQSSTPPLACPPTRSQVNINAIVGSIVGGLAGVVLFGLLIRYLSKIRTQPKRDSTKSRARIPTTFQIRSYNKHLELDTDLHHEPMASGIHPYTKHLSLDTGVDRVHPEGDIQPYQKHVDLDVNCDNGVEQHSTGVQLRNRVAELEEELAEMRRRYGPLEGWREGHLQRQGNNGTRRERTIDGLTLPPDYVTEVDTGLRATV